MTKNYCSRGNVVRFYLLDVFVHALFLVLLEIIGHFKSSAEYSDSVHRSRNLLLTEESKEQVSRENTYLHTLQIAES